MRRLRCHRKGVPVDAIFTDYWKLDEADAAYKKADSQSTGKGCIVEF